MYIEKLDDERLLVTLDNIDINLIGQRKNKSSFDVPMDIFGGLLSLAVVKAGFRPDSKRLSVQVLSGVGCFFLIITVRSQLKLPRGRDSVVKVELSCADDIFSCVSRLKLLDTARESRLYKYRKHYQLLVFISSDDLPNVLPILAEYGRVREISLHELLRLEEYGIPLIAENAIEKL